LPIRGGGAGKEPLKRRSGGGSEWFLRKGIQIWLGSSEKGGRGHLIILLFGGEKIIPAIKRLYASTKPSGEKGGGGRIGKRSRAPEISKKRRGGGGDRVIYFPSPSKKKGGCNSVEKNSKNWCIPLVDERGGGKKGVGTPSHLFLMWGRGGGRSGIRGISFIIKGERGKGGAAACRTRGNFVPNKERKEKKKKKRLDGGGDFLWCSQRVRRKKGGERERRDINYRGEKSQTSREDRGDLPGLSARRGKKRGRETSSPSNALRRKKREHCRFKVVIDLAQPHHKRGKEKEKRYNPVHPQREGKKEKTQRCGSFGMLEGKKKEKEKSASGCVGGWGRGREKKKAVRQGKRGGITSVSRGEKEGDDAERKIVNSPVPRREKGEKKPPSFGRTRGKKKRDW